MEVNQAENQEEFKVPDLGDFLNSINSNKKNIVRDSQDTEKAYLPFVIARSLSYHMDSIFIVSELNQRGTAAHGVDNLRHYEFLLHTIRPGKRFSKWSKPEVNDPCVELIARKYSCSLKRANELLPLMDSESRRAILAEYDIGGIEKKNGTKTTKPAKRGNKVSS